VLKTLKDLRMSQKMLTFKCRKTGRLTLVPAVKEEPHLSLSDKCGGQNYKLRMIYPYVAWFSCISLAVPARHPLRLA